MVRVLLFILIATNCHASVVPWGCNPFLGAVGEAVQYYSITMQEPTNGKIESDDGNFDCGDGGTDCGPFLYLDADSPEFTATGATGYEFSAWTPTGVTDTSDATNPDNITIDKADVDTFSASFTLTGGSGTISLVTPNGTSSNTSTSSNDLILDVPSGVNDGDIMYAALLNDVDIAINTPSGWTLAGTQVSASSSRLAFFYRVASSEPATYTFSFAGGSPNTFTGCIVAFEKTSGTWDAVQDIQTNSGLGVTELASTTVTTTDGSFAVGAWGSDDTVTVGSTTGMTNAIFVAPTSAGVGIWYESITTGSSYTDTWTTAETGDKTSIMTVLEAE